MTKSGSKSSQISAVTRAIGERVSTRLWEITEEKNENSETTEPWTPVEKTDSGKDK